MAAYTEKFTKDLNAFYEWVNAESEIELKDTSEKEISGDITWDDIRDEIEFTEPGRNKLDSYIKKVLEDFVVSFEGEDCDDYKTISKMYKDHIEKKKQEKKELKTKEKGKKAEKPKKPKEKVSKVKKVVKDPSPMDIDEDCEINNDRVRISIAIEILKKCTKFDCKLIINLLEHTIKQRKAKEQEDIVMEDSDDDKPIKRKGKKIEVEKVEEKVEKKVENVEEKTENIKKFESIIGVSKKLPEKTQAESDKDLAALFEELKVDNTNVNLNNIQDDGEETEEIDDGNETEEIDEEDLFDNMD